MRALQLARHQCIGLVEQTRTREHRTGAVDHRLSLVDVDVLDLRLRPGTRTSAINGPVMHRPCCRAARAQLCRWWPTRGRPGLVSDPLPIRRVPRSSFDQLRAFGRFRRRDCADDVVAAEGDLVVMLAYQLGAPARFYTGDRIARRFAGFASSFAVATAASACSTSRDEASRCSGGQLRASFNNVAGTSLSGTVAPHRCPTSSRRAVASSSADSGLAGERRRQQLPRRSVAREAVVEQLHVLGGLDRAFEARDFVSVGSEQHHRRISAEVVRLPSAWALGALPSTYTGTNACDFATNSSRVKMVDFTWLHGGHHAAVQNRKTGFLSAIARENAVSISAVVFVFTQAIDVRAASSQRHASVAAQATFVQAGSKQAHAIANTRVVLIDVPCLASRMRDAQFIAAAQSFGPDSR